MLVTSKELFKKAKKEGYAIGAFNTSSLEITRGIITAAEKLNSPVIIETSPGEVEFLTPEVSFAQVKALAEKATVPVVLHLDHGRSAEMVREAIEVGYTSVHIDGSALPFKENVALTKELAEVAHEKGLTVEGEIGHVTGASELHRSAISINKESLTEPIEAAEFVKQTKVDILAVAIGNIHGVYQSPPKLELGRFTEIGQAVDIFFSLHGGSGIPKNQIKEAIRLGMVKVNVNTELRLAFHEGLMHEFEVHPDQVVPYKYLPAGTEAVQKVVENKIRLFGSANKA